MKRNLIPLLALLLACLMILSACASKPGQSNIPDDPNQQGSSGGSQNSGGTGSGQGGGGSQSGSTGDPDGSGQSGSTDPNGGNQSGSADPTKTTQLGQADGVTYQLVEFDRTATDNDATRYQLCAVSGADGQSTVLYATEGDFVYAAGSLEASGNTALYFTASKQEGGKATLYCYDLYNKDVQQVLAAPCSNMVVFAGSGQWDGYGWILQHDYVMAIDLQNQMADMTQAASTAELSGFAGVGSSFFGTDKTASIKESEYGVLEVTVTTGSSLQGYLYTCDTFTAVALK